MADGQKVTSVNYGLTFFSDSRLQSLSARLRNDKLHDLTHRISLVLQARAKPTDSVSTGLLSRKRENAAALYDDEQASKWIQSKSSYELLIHYPPSLGYYKLMTE